MHNFLFTPPLSPRKFPFANIPRNFHLILSFSTPSLNSTNPIITTLIPSDTTQSTHKSQVLLPAPPLQAMPANRSPATDLVPYKFPSQALKEYPNSA
ncbi:hypothetical protein PGT21_037095 [Puccinia graminis f. sp. tritici]|uniref:Uncharacterized protein n=1 Tax=Puccinia graminis f. sp. tritici TaxID=56615 RepID=A0A5B0QQG8_PUCGR|nr:hypothetical protein PGT21_037095 [Puccinia graminis f. sp. tritici]